MPRFKHCNYDQDSMVVINYHEQLQPAILLKIILFAYSKGITSSREIQWCCETNIIFKALSCDTVPHFTTLAKFVSLHADEIEELFEQILLVCHEQGLTNSPRMGQGKGKAIYGHRMSATRNRPEAADKAAPARR